MVEEPTETSKGQQLLERDRELKELKQILCLGLLPAYMSLHNMPA